MNKLKFSIVIFLVIVLLSVFLMGCTINTGATATETIAPSSGSLTGEEIMQATCGRCHNLSRVTSKHKTAEQWKVTVDRMMSRGAKLTADEKQTLLDYLSATYK
jgi:competence protein ComEA